MIFASFILKKQPVSKEPNVEFTEIALSMNMMTTIPSEIRPNFVLNRLIANRQLIGNGGREVSSKENL